MHKSLLAGAFLSSLVAGFTYATPSHAQSFYDAINGPINSIANDVSNWEQEAREWERQHPNGVPNRGYQNTPVVHQIIVG